jgi:hypothetical protein
MEVWATIAGPIANNEKYLRKKSLEQI